MNAAMNPDDGFNLNAFAQSLTAHPPAERAARVAAEVQRVRTMTVRDSAKRFSQQMYGKALERLGRALGGHDVGGELSPSERPAHALLLSVAPAAVEAVPPPPPPAAPPLAAPPVVETAAATAAAPAPEPSGPERRTSRRIQMKTRVRIRRDSDNVSEVLEPINLSRGGVGFQSCKRYALHETVWVTMHYQPDNLGAKGHALDGAAEMETKSIIVRAAPIPQSTEFSYGLKFL
jgi:hypothetical protein